MIPILYESTETNFTSNGLGRLRDCISCVCSEERNGIYEVEFEYPVSGAHFDDIKCGRIIGVEHDETNDIQPFDIYYYSRPINGVVTFRASHISYRLNKMTLQGGAGATGIQNAFALLSSSTPANPFTFETDIVNTDSYMSATAKTPISVRAVLGGTEGSILDAFGGEYEWDKWKVILHKQRGRQKALTIRYGVNLTDFTDETDFSDTFTSILPYWSGNVNGKDVVVRGNVVHSGLTPYDGRDVCVPMDFTDKFEKKPTKTQLQNVARTYMTSHKTNLPSQTIEVDFVRLADSSEYERFASLQSCRLCDTVQVEFPRYKMSGAYKIVKTEYNVLTERFDRIELGDLSTSLADALGLNNSSGSTTDNSSLFMRKLYTATIASVSANKDVTAADLGLDTDWPDGYTAIGVYDFGSSTAGIALRSARVAKSGTVLQIRNMTSSAISNVAVKLGVVFAPEDLVTGDSI